MVCAFFYFRSNGQNYSLDSSFRKPLSKSPAILDRVELDEAERVAIIEAQSLLFATLRTELSHGDRVSAKPLARLSPFRRCNTRRRPFAPFGSTLQS